MISANDLRSGKIIEYQNSLWMTVSFQHVKMGRGSAYVKVKLKNLKSNAIVEQTFRPEDKFELAYIERQKAQFLFAARDEYHFLNQETYEEVVLDEDLLGENVKYFCEGLFLDVLYYDAKPIGIELPNSVELKVVDTDPGLRGDTASGGSKPAKLETGLVVSVPLFIAIGDILKVDTRSGEYISRA
jgi:elongation factor P